MTFIRHSLAYVISALSTWIEHILRAFWPFFAVCLILASIILSGWHGHLSDWTFQVIGYGAIILTLFQSIKRFKFPHHKDIQRNITRASRWPLNPYRILRDTPAKGQSPLDETELRRKDLAERYGTAEKSGAASHLNIKQRKMWTKARNDAKRLRGKIWPALPALNTNMGDKYGLRFVAIAVFTIAFFASPDNRVDRFTDAMTPTVPKLFVFTPQVAEIWVTPPEYTRLAPVTITGSGKGQKLVVPNGSTVTARVNKGWVTPTLTTPTTKTKFTPSEGRGYTATYTLNENDSRLRIHSMLETHMKLPLEVQVDQPAIVSIVEGPDVTERDRLSLRYAAQDDFGIDQVIIRLSADPMVLRRLGSPEPFERIVPLRGKTFIDQSLTLDINDHILAGLPADLTVTVIDTFGNETVTTPIGLIVPEMEFSHPLARQIAAIRKELIWSNDKDSLKLFSNMLANIREKKTAYRDDITVYLGLTTALYRMRLSETLFDKDLKDVRDLLWAIALHIDGGSSRVAAEELQNALEEMSQALSNPNLTDEEFEALQQRVQEAMQNYMQSLIEELQAQLQEQGPIDFPEELREQLQNNLNTDQAMQEMLDALQNGSREEVEQAMEQMQRMMEALKNMDMRPMTEETRQMMEELAKLKEIIQEQEKILDQTRTITPDDALNQPEDYGDSLQNDNSIFGDNSDLPPSPSEQFRNTPLEPIPPKSPLQSEPPTQEIPDGMTAEDLSKDQQALQDKLKGLRERIEELTGEDPEFMQRADKAMKDARDALANDAPEAAIPHEERALRELQEGMSESMQNMAQSIGSMITFGMPQMGRPQGGEGRDPLGRQRGDNGTDTSTQDIDMSEEEKRRRLRAIRDKILEKSDQIDQDPTSEEYYDNLLERF